MSEDFLRPVTWRCSSVRSKMNRVSDLGIKLKHVCDDINMTDEIKIFRDKFLLPDNESIDIIETGEEIIVYI